MSEVSKTWDAMMAGNSVPVPQWLSLFRDLNERLTALETARATEPVSDDEIVEALARTRFENLFVNEVWSTEAEDSQRDFRDFARCQYASLQSLGYDLVKRS